MNCSDNVSSDVVLPEENVPSTSQTGMGYAHMYRLLPVVKWDSDDLIIIYDPGASFYDVFTDATIVSFSEKYGGGEK